MNTALLTLIQAEEFAITVWHRLTKWKVTHFQSLPQWLQDNDFLHFGHRPPLPTSECFKSIVRIHTETGNIWTHLLGTRVEFVFCLCMQMESDRSRSARISGISPCKFIIIFRRRRFLRPGRLLPDAASDRDPGAREDSFRVLLRRSHHLHGP